VSGLACEDEEEEGPGKISWTISEPLHPEERHEEDHERLYEVEGYGDEVVDIEEGFGGAGSRLVKIDCREDDDDGSKKQVDGVHHKEEIFLMILFEYLPKDRSKTESCHADAHDVYDLKAGLRAGDIEEFIDHEAEHQA